MRRYILITLLLPTMLLLGTVAAAMPYFRHFTTSDGLVHPDVMSICQDSLGRIWFGTENGLSIYDGTRMRSYKPYDQKHGSICFKEGLVNKIVCDRWGNVFFITSSELVHYNPRTDSMETLLEGELTALYIDSGVACAVRGREHFRYVPTSPGSMEATRELPFTGIRDLLRTPDGNLYLICPEGLFRSRGDGPFRQISPVGDLYSLFMSSSGEIWTGSNTEGLLRVFADGTIRQYTTATDDKRGFRNNNIRAVAQDSEGLIWFGSFNGLNSYDTAADTFHAYYREDREGGLSSSSIHALLKDRDGILWAGTYYGGVSFTDTRAGAFSFFPAMENGGEGLSFPVAGHLMEDARGRVWICTEGGGLNCLDPASGFISVYGTGYFTNAKWLAAYPEKEALYIATNRQGLFRLNTGSGHIVQEISPGKTDSPFYVINVVERYKDGLILSTDDGVWLHSLSGGSDTLLYPRTDGVRYVHAIVGGERLFLASSSVVEVDLESHAVLREIPILTENGPARPMRLLLQPDGTLYASTFGHGIFKLEEDTFRPLAGSPRSGYQLVTVPGGRMLVSAEQEIQLLDSTGVILQRHLIGENLPLEALVLDSGLLLTREGTVYAGGTNGLVSFSLEGPSKAIDDSLYFSEIHADGVPLPLAVPYCEAVRLKGLQKHLDIHLSSRHNITSTHWPQYEYRLRGRENAWRPVTGPVLSESQLRVGKYALEVRRKGEDSPVCSLPIVIRSYWYASALAKTLYLVLVIALLWVLAKALYLRREAAQVQEMNETKLRFFTTVSHELRSPLTIIVAQIDGILQTFHLAPQVRSKMGKVRSQALQLNQLVTELIDFRKLEQNQIRLNLSTASVNLFAADIVEKFRELAASKQLSVRFVPSPDAPKAAIDNYQMQKVLMNLLFNAVKFTPRGGCIELEVCARPSQDTVEIHVRDTGIGIDEADKERIFERFYQGKGTETVAEGIPSSGIGLALAKDIVQLHHGTIKVNNRDSGGADFVITLEAVHEEAERSTPQEVFPLPGAKIVIAEDNPEMSALLEELFGIQYQVFTASDGVEALELVKRENPSIVLSDLLMPRMGGEELCAAIKGDPRLSGIPVVILTAMDSNQKRMEGLLKGADDFIGKPFDSKILLARCNNLVQSKLQMAGAETDRKLALKATNPQEKDFLERVSAIIDQNLGNADLDMNTVASLMNMSRTRFYTRFREFTSESPAHYISERRLNRACEILLSQPGLSVAEVADMLGFNTQNYFCRRFKERYGVSPMQYRQSQK